MLALLAIAAGCRARPEPGPLEPRPVHTLETWVAESNGERLGVVSLMEIVDPAGKVRFYRAQNGSGQWLGYVDKWGRVFRSEPFVEHEVFVGTYPMEEGLALLYEQDRPVQLVPLAEVEAREAAHHRAEDQEPPPKAKDDQ